MSWSRRLGLFLIAWISLCSAVARAAEQFPRYLPSASEGRVFIRVGTVGAVRLQASLPLYTLSTAETCGLDPDRIQQLLGPLLEHDSRVIQQLEEFLPGAFSQLQSIQPLILVDNFGERAKFARSFFLLVDGKSVVALNCSEQDRQEWPAILTHELVHVLVRERGLEEWFEEGIAKLVEERMGSFDPMRKANKFASASLLPPLLNGERPLSSFGEYAIAFLFVKYIWARWGGWTTLQAMVNGSSREQASMQYLSNLARQARESIERRDPQGAKARIDKMTARGTLLHFYAALAMNHPRFPEYSIPGWSGLGPTQKDISPADVELMPGQALRLKDWDPSDRLNSALEGYHFRWNDDTFQIDPISSEDSVRDNTPNVWTRETYVIVNTSQSIQPVLSGARTILGKIEDPTIREGSPSQ